MNKKINKLKTDEMFFTFPISFAEADVKEKMEIQIIPVGKWKHNDYGDMKVTKDDIKQFANNFKLRKGVPITKGHAKMGEELPAVGWFKKLINKGSDGLWAIVEWTDIGLQMLKEKAYKYFSPEIHWKYEDPQTHKVYKNVLTGGALTNYPYFKELQAIVLSEKCIFNQFNNNDMALNLKEILEKEVADLSDEEKKFLVENKDELTDEDNEKYKDILEVEDKDDDKDDDKDEDKDKDKDEDKDEDKDDKDEDKDKDKDDKDEDDDKDDEGKMSASEVKLLQDKADKGVEALLKLTEMETKEVVKTYVFSESNSEGKILPKSQDKVVNFMMSLNEGQVAKFKELLSELPKVQIFGEIGDAGSEDDTSNKIDKLVKTKMTGDKSLKYSDALKSVFSENVELAKEYEKDMKI